jgi:hypothetical protein
MLQAFYRHEAEIQQVALEKAKRGLLRSDGVIFIRPDDLKLIARQSEGACDGDGTRWI